MSKKLENKILDILQESIKEMKKIRNTSKEVKVLSENSAPEVRGTKVIFDKSTNSFEVDYSERGFEINGVRFSFEFLEDALAKKVYLILDEGRGMTLDNVKIEKILKYKYLYTNQQAEKNKIKAQQNSQPGL